MKEVQKKLTYLSPEVVSYEVASENVMAGSTLKEGGVNLGEVEEGPSISSIGGVSTF